MAALKSAAWLQLIESHEARLCLRCNAACRSQTVRRFFAIISRLGDGLFWYALMVVLPFVYGGNALATSLHMIVAGVIGVLIYKWLKVRLVRERPYVAVAGIERGARALDRYSFPSGHTLHAVSFSIVVLSAFPQLTALLATFAALVAMSRVVLGLHYPSDVLVGAALGAVIALATQVVVQL